MKNYILLLLLPAALLAFSTTAHAQLNPAFSHLGLGGGVVIPAGDMGDRYDLGYEFHAKNVAHLSEHFAIGLQLGLQMFAGNTVVETNNMEVSYQDELQFVLSVGPEYRMDNWFFGVHLGYIAADNMDSEVILIPTAGFQFGAIELSARYKMLGDYNWFGAGLTFYFIEW